jgi:hypothetical protein
MYFHYTAFPPKLQWQLRRIPHGAARESFFMENDGQNLLYFVLLQQRSRCSPSIENRSCQPMEKTRTALPQDKAVPFLFINKTIRSTAYFAAS